MSDKVKRIMNFRFDRFETAEKKLEKMAEMGLFLEECGSFFWTFKKGTPKKLKYTVTYFSEGSIFNPGITANQETFFDYAKDAGWNFVTQYNQMQIFSSEAEHPVPFETDEKVKLNNIKKCMNKSFIPSVVSLIFVFALNLTLHYNSFRFNPIDFLADKGRLIPFFMFSVFIMYELYSLINYFTWTKKSERMIENGGACANSTNGFQRFIEILFMSLIIGSLVYFLFFLADRINGFAVVLAVAQTPLMMFIFWISINFLRRKRASALKNKVISSALVITANFGYFALIIVFIMSRGLSINHGPNYRTVDWQLSETDRLEYRLYSDTIPLTSEDLYGPIDYSFYSYEEETDHTLFLHRSRYSQDSPPARNAPPRIEYEVLEPQADFVYGLAKNHLLEIPEWQDDTTLKIMDNTIFGTIDAYQRFYGNIPTGQYTLFFEDRIILLNLEEAATEAQISVIKKKLEL